MAAPARQSGHSLGVFPYGDPYERPLGWLMEERAKLARERDPRKARWIRRGIAHWRQVITVSVATQRAESGDRTAARRLAWRAAVLKKSRRHVTWLLERYRAWDRQMRSLTRQGIASCPCAGCDAQVARVRRNLEEFLAEIAALPESAPPAYREYARQQSAEERGAEAWLRRRLEGLGS